MIYSPSFPTWGHRTMPERVKVEKGKADDLRIAHLSLCPRPTAGAAFAIPEPDAVDLGKTRHPPGRVLDDADRREQPAAHLYARLGQHGRAREALGRVPGRPRMGSQPLPRPRRMALLCRTSAVSCCCQPRSPR